MRQQYVRCKSRYQAQKQCPWAAKIGKVLDGFICFEDIRDYYIWKHQL